MTFIVFTINCFMDIKILKEVAFFVINIILKAEITFFYSWSVIGILIYWRTKLHSCLELEVRGKPSITLAFIFYTAMLMLAAVLCLKDYYWLP